MQNAPEPFLLKNIYSPEFVDRVCAEIGSVWPEFNAVQFRQSVFDAQWPARELKQRTRHISTMLRQSLPPDYKQALNILLETAERMIARDGERMAFDWGILPDFVEAFGVETPDISIPALARMTRLSSAEFAIRPFLLRYPERMHAQMFEWSGHDSPMVRRLASEGFRPRLPWGMGIPALKKDPSPILPVLETLKQDPAETVRRSVANNLNDISKDHPDLALDIAARWLGAHPDTDRVVRHACRGLLKKGHPRALALFGFEHGVGGVEIQGFYCDDFVSTGGVFHFSFDLHYSGDQPVSLRLEYAIHYLTSTGAVSRKVFQIKELDLNGAAGLHIERQQRFQNFTTRKHFPGQHRIDILINGVARKTAYFNVT